MERDDTASRSAHRSTEAANQSLPLRSPRVVRPRLPRSPWQAISQRLATGCLRCPRASHRRGRRDRREKGREVLRPPRRATTATPHTEERSQRRRSETWRAARKAGRDERAAIRARAAFDSRARDSPPSHHDSPAVPAGDATGHCWYSRPTPTDEFHVLFLRAGPYGLTASVRLRVFVVSPLTPSPRSVSLRHQSDS